MALTYKAFPTRFQGHWLVLSPLLGLAGILVLRRLWESPPAVTMCAALVLTVFSGGWSLMGLGGLPLNRLLMALVLLQIFLRAPGAAHMPRLRIRNVHLLMCFTLLYALASAAASGTLTSKSGFLQFFDVFGVIPFLLFLIAPAVFSGRWERNLLLTTLVGLGAYLGCTAIFELFGPHSLVFPGYIHRVDAAFGELKANGPFQSTVAEGFANFACAVAAVIAFHQWRGQRKSYLAAFVVAVCLVGCFLTLERGVWIATVTAAIVTAASTQTGRRLLAPGLLISAITIAGVLLISSDLAHRTSGRVTEQHSVWDRQNQTSTGLRMVSAKPLFGFGLNRYSTDSLDYFRQPADYPMTGYVHGVTISVPEARLPLHDTYLSYAVELGLLGALLWLASLAWAMGDAVFSRSSTEHRPWKLGLVAIFVFFLVFSFVDPHYAPFPVVLLLTWAGVALGTEPLPEPVLPQLLSNSTVSV